MTKRERHHYILQCARYAFKQAVGNIQYSIFPFEDKIVFHIEGSNETKDWRFNLMYFGIFFHIGYMLMALKLKGYFPKSKRIILSGESFGAGTASVLYWLLWGRVDELVLFGCPPSYTWLNPLIPLRCTNYRIEGDIVTYANILRPLFRQCRPVTLLPRQSDKPIENHTSYLKALKG